MSAQPRTSRTRPDFNGRSIRYTWRTRRSIRRGSKAGRSPRRGMSHARAGLYRQRRSNRSPSGLDRSNRAGYSRFCLSRWRANMTWVSRQSDSIGRSTGLSAGPSMWAGRSQGAGLSRQVRKEKQPGCRCESTLSHRDTGLQSCTPRIIERITFDPDAARDCVVGSPVIPQELRGSPRNAGLPVVAACAARCGNSPHLMRE